MATQPSSAEKESEDNEDRRDTQNGEGSLP